MEYWYSVHTVRFKQKVHHNMLTLDCPRSSSGSESLANSLVVSILIEMLVGRCTERKYEEKYRGGSLWLANKIYPKSEERMME